MTVLHIIPCSFYQSMCLYTTADSYDTTIAG